MPNYKDINNKVHYLDSEEFEHLLPTGCVQITDEEVEEIQRKNIYKPSYADLRRHEYPPMADYLDGIVKGDQAQIDKYIADCLAVKAKYPKD